MNKNINLLVSYGLFLLTLIFVICYSYTILLEKKGYYIDEICTFNNANQFILSFSDFWDIVSLNKSEQFISNFIEQERVGEFIYDDTLRKICVLDDSGFNFFNLFVVLSLGDAHPPIYYLLIHTICSITHTTNINIIGYILNIIPLIVSLFFIFRIVYSLTSKSILAVMPVMLYGLSYEFFNTITFFRMYSLLTLEFLIIHYQYYLLQCNLWKIENKWLWKTIAIQLIALLTHYYSFIFMSAYFLIALFKLKTGGDDYKKYLRYNMVMILFFILLWPSFIIQIFRAMSYKLSIDAIPIYGRIINILSIIRDSVFGGALPCYIACAFMFLFLIMMQGKKYRIKNEMKKHILFFPFIVYTIIVVLISPLVNARYISPIIPFVFIIICISANSLLKKSILCYISCFILCLVCFLNWNKKISLSYLYNTEEAAIYKESYSELPAIIVDSNNSIMYFDIAVNYVHPKYIKTYENEILNTMSKYVVSEETYVLYTEKTCNSDLLKQNITSLGYSLNPIDYEPQFFNVHLLKKN